MVFPHYLWERQRLLMKIHSGLSLRMLLKITLLLTNLLFKHIGITSIHLNEKKGFQSITTKLISNQILVPLCCICLARLNSDWMILIYQLNFSDNFAMLLTSEICYVSFNFIKL